MLTENYLCRRFLSSRYDIGNNSDFQSPHRLSFYNGNTLDRDQVVADQHSGILQNGLKMQAYKMLFNNIMVFETHTMMFRK